MIEILFLKSVFIKIHPEDFETQSVWDAVRHGMVSPASGQTPGKTPSVPLLDTEGQVLKAPPLVSAFAATPRILLLWLATFTLTMQPPTPHPLPPHPLPCISLIIQRHFQRILKHNTFYFSVLVKIYESTKCTPAGNYIPLENAFTEGWNLIRKESEILRGSQPPSLLFQCSNHPNLGTQYFLTCEGWLLCYNI